MQRLDSLDAVRGVAVGLVVYDHLWGGPELAGSAGVILFFFLSGFLIYSTYDPRTYVQRRTFRILPMYWLSIVAAFLLGPWSVQIALQNAFFIASKSNWMSVVYWTLYIEVAFYVLAPLILLSWTVVSVIPALFAIVWLIWGPIVAPFYLSFCFIGLQIGAWRAGRLPEWLLLANIVVCVAASCFMRELGPAFAVVALAAFSAVWTVIRFGLPRVSLLSGLGRISYSVYLLHPLVGAAMLTNFDASVTTLVCLLVSWICYRLVELPFIRLGRVLTWPRVA
ncbi:MAG: acyltransferase [Pseudolabrys sp.]|nr:acyltransferase [Pseudolabrys sp.]